VVASAHDLKEFDEESLDFVFSNHVFEHLPNPLGALDNWFGKLKPGGVVAGVVPDARFTFDLRQPLSTLDECEDEFAKGCYQLERRHYERWCQHTAPYNTVEDLMSRKYSVHAKYYSADTFRSLLERSAAMTGWSEIFVNATRNGKDFGFLLRK
jgi:predicted SAM-dependent methyltransferase